MNYKELYQRKLVPVLEALEAVKSNQEIVCSLAACEPVTLLSNLHHIKDKVENVSVVNAMMMGEYEFLMNQNWQGNFS